MFEKLNKTAIIIIAVLFPCTATNAQEYNNWLLVDGSILNFNTSPAKLIPKDEEDSTNYVIWYSNYTVALSDDNGRIVLYGYLEKNNNSKANYVIKNSDKQDVIRLTLGYDPCNVIGCKSPEGRYYIAIAYSKTFTSPAELCVYQFDPNGQLENEYIYQKADSYTFLMDFIQLDDCVALVAYCDNRMETYKLTSDGCVLWNTSPISLDSHFSARPTPFFNIAHTLDGTTITVGINNVAYVFKFNKKTGEVSISYVLEAVKFNAMAFSKTDNYFLVIDDGKLKGFRYDKNFDFNLGSPDIVYDLSKHETSHVWEMATGVDGKLYIYQHLTDYIIVLNGIESESITQEPIYTGNLHYANFPQISRRIETPDCIASASFDNAYACHGQPLNILSSGDAPFEIFYTIDGDELSVKTSEPSYQLPDVPGKYVITKIKDASCEAVPTANNTAEIAPDIRQVRIVEE